MPADPPAALTRARRTTATTTTMTTSTSGAQVEVRRSARRRRTVSAYRSEGRIVVLLPARMSRAEEQQWVERMVSKLERRAARTSPPRGDTVLLQRAQELSAQWLDGRAQPAGVRWSDQQQRRWGSCSIDVGVIRLSRRLDTMPSWVIDYVLVHELTHLLVADHSAEFHRWVARYPDTARAQAFLAGVEHGAGMTAEPEPGGAETEEPEPARAETDGGAPDEAVPDEAVPDEAEP